jgi:hypothetical protein
MTHFDLFFNAYIETALWASTDDDERPLDDWADKDDLAPSALAEMKADCVDFFKANYNLIRDNVSRAGHDFFLTRNRHGAGFWDGDWKHGDRLTSASHPYGSCDLYVGDDGKIYVY